MTRGVATCSWTPPTPLGILTSPSSASRTDDRTAGQSRRSSWRIAERSRSGSSVPAGRWGSRTVAVFSEADRGSLHVRLADEAVHVGPAPARDSYLVPERILEAAARTGADAIHPGYGFLSERADFNRACRAAGLVFIGPPPESQEAMGVKTSARRRMKAAGVPVVPGSEGPIADEAAATAEAERIGYPVMLKAAAGGGGKGMKRCDRAEDFGKLWQTAKRESASAFGDDRIYLEKFLEKPRHVEVQVFADEHGNVVHMGERECSVQRRHQKIVEESPSAVVDAAMRAAMGKVAVEAARAVGYVGAGTVELLVDASGELLLPGDEHPPAGRAPGHRDGHRHRPGPAPDRGGPGRPGAGPGGDRAARPRRRGPGLRRGPGPRLPAVAGEDHLPARPRRARDCATTPASTAGGWCRPTTTR